jgi:hypothetical protein
MEIKNLIKILGALKHKGLIDDEAIAYSPELYPFTQAEFLEVFGELSLLQEPTDISREFEEYVSLFEFKGQQFFWRLLIGQGSASQLLTPIEAADFFSAPVLMSLKPYKIEV